MARTVGIQGVVTSVRQEIAGATVSASLKQAEALIRQRTRDVTSFRVEGDLGATARRLDAYYRSMGGRGGLIEQANNEALYWVKRKAAANLDKAVKANRRPTYARTGALRKVIMAKESHELTSDGFRFMVEDRVRAQIPYAFSLEYGDDSQVGKFRWFLFLGRKSAAGRTTRSYFESFNRRGDRGARHTQAHGRSITRSNNAFFGVQHHKHAFGSEQTVTDRLVGRREFNSGNAKFGENFVEGNRVRVRIRNPVPQYAYGRKAGQEFVDTQQYQTILLRLFSTWNAKTNSQLVPASKTPVKKARKKPLRLKGTGLNGDVTQSNVNDE